MSDGVCLVSDKLKLILEFGNKLMEDIEDTEEKLIIYQDNTEFSMYGEFDDIMGRKLTDMKLSDIMVLSELAKLFTYNFSELDQEMRFMQFAYRLVKAIDPKAKLVYASRIPKEKWDSYTDIWVYSLFYGGRDE